MPTWRTSLTNAGDYAITGKDNYNDAFLNQITLSSTMI